MIEMYWKTEEIMDIWMSIFNTTTQGLRDFPSRSNPDSLQKDYLKEKFNKLIGSIKLFKALDQSFGFTDNHLIDSGLIRALFRYSNDSEIRRMKDELKDIFFASADKIIYVFDNRVTNDAPATLVRDRFNKTVGEAHRSFIHSAAFSNENEWKHIDKYEDLIKSYPEYKHVFTFLIELLEQIPSENKIDNPIKEDSFHHRLEDMYQSKKGEFQDNVRFRIGEYFQEFKNKKTESHRSSFYDFMKPHLQEDAAIVLHRFFTDHTYNLLAPWELGGRYSFEEWDAFSILPEGIPKVYKTPPSVDDNLLDKLYISIEQLSQKGENFLSLASQNIEIIEQIQADVRKELLKDKPNTKKLAFNTLLKLYSAENPEEASDQIVDLVLESVPPIVSVMAKLKGWGLITPFLKEAHQKKRLVEFMYLSAFNTEYKNVTGLFDEILSQN